MFIGAWLGGNLSDAFARFADDSYSPDKQILQHKVLRNCFYKSTSYTSDFWGYSQMMSANFEGVYNTFTIIQSTHVAPSYLFACLPTNKTIKQPSP